jgi:hypothetical protein
VHAVVQKESNVLWRGAAPRQDTVEALAAKAAAHDKTVTIFDLRQPSNDDDRSGKAGRLSPEAEKALADKLHVQYVSVSALEHDLPARIDQALRSGDVYIHCMYGVNRTGFACGRYEVADGLHVDHTGLGNKDIQEGIDFQHKVAASPAP